MTFKQLGLIEPILKALVDKGYETPSPIQAQSIPILLDKKDLLGCAQTGTGKTAAFAIPIIQQIYNDVEQEKAAFGVLVCGSANGVAITANKHAGIRAAICWEKEIAILARAHNNANIICLPARFITTDAAFEMVDTFLSTPFEGGRHQTRVGKI